MKIKLIRVMAFSLTLCRAYFGQLVPHLVFNMEEETLSTLCRVLACPLTDLLRNSLASCMVLILTCWAQGEGEGQGEEIRQQATASHALLCNYMSEEVRTMAKVGKIHVF